MRQMAVIVLFFSVFRHSDLTGSFVKYRFQTDPDKRQTKWGLIQTKRDLCRTNRDRVQTEPDIQQTEWDSGQTERGFDQVRWDFRKTNRDNHMTDPGGSASQPTGVSSGIARFFLKQWFDESGNRQRDKIRRVMAVYI